MEKYLFVNTFLRLLSQGNLLNRIFAIILRISAVAIILWGLIIFIYSWKGFTLLPAEGILGGIIFTLLWIVGMYMVVHTYFIRAKDIVELPPSEYPVISIFSIFLKLIGESYAWLLVTLGISGGLLIWFIGPDFRYFLRGIPNFLFWFPFFGFSESNFLAGILLMLAGVVIALLVLLVSYFLSEAIVVTVNIAKNTQLLREIAERRVE